MLPDVALLRIFDFCLDDEEIDAWHVLVHVCQTWRNLVFESPRRLDLQLHFKSTTRIQDADDVWPPLPISIRVLNHRIRFISRICSTLYYNDRICELTLWRVASDQLDEILEEMQEPYPALRVLSLEPGGQKVLKLPPSFLGGSAPCLQKLEFYHVLFPGLQALLLSATHLVHLQLWKILHPGYISPEAMVTCLAVLTKLESLTLWFQPPPTHPDQKSRPPTYTHLPALTKLDFRGHGQYLEDLVARIDSPLLEELYIKFDHQSTFDAPNLAHFIRRTPKFKAHDEECVVFFERVTLPQTFGGKLDVKNFN